jgi:2-hydroxy-6-oxonona-2,4-dienedioate hydrolase
VSRARHRRPPEPTRAASTPLGTAAAEWARSRHVRGGRWRFRYREAGAGPPVVLVHGLGVYADYWVRNGPALATAGYRVLAPDLPGFGRTAGGPAAVEVGAQAEALAVWAAALELEAAVYVGHSVSCQAVLELAGRFPDRVRGLVLAAPTLGLRSRAVPAEAVRFAFDAFLEEPRLYPFILEAYVRTGPLRWLRTWRASRRHDVLAAAARVRTPALVVLGSRDPVVQPSGAAELAARLPGARLVVVDGGAHALIFRPADRFNDAVLAFLATLGSPA